MRLKWKSLSIALALVSIISSPVLASVEISNGPSPWYPDTSQSAAQHYTISPDLSYVHVMVPVWEQGAPRYDLSIDGPPVFAGYEWTLTTTTEHYAMSGSLDLLAVSNLTSNEVGAFEVDVTKVVTSAPTELKVGMPSSLAFTTTTGALTNCMLCVLPSAEALAFDYSTLNVNGTLTGNVLTLSGATTYSEGIAHYTVQGGLTAPALPNFSYANAYYSYLLVASVPEPSQAAMLLCGLLLILVLPHIGAKLAPSWEWLRLPVTRGNS